MGDRALVQFKDNNEVSPVVYLHWDGSEVKDWLQELRELMGDRFSDVSYTCARFIGVCHSHIKGNLSLGVFTQTTELKGTDSHGDAGCLVVDVETGKVECSGGYYDSFSLAEDTEEQTAQSPTKAHSPSGLCWSDSLLSTTLLRRNYQ